MVHQWNGLWKIPFFFGPLEKPRGALQALPWKVLGQHNSLDRWDIQRSPGNWLPSRKSRPVTSCHMFAMTEQVALEPTSENNPFGHKMTKHVVWNHQTKKTKTIIGDMFHFAIISSYFGLVEKYQSEIHFFISSIQLQPGLRMAKKVRFVALSP